MPLLQQETSVAFKLESWARPYGVSTPPNNKFWPVFLNIKDTKRRKQPFSKSSINADMWDSFFPVLWQNFLDDKSQFHVAWNRVCIITPYRAMTAHIQDFLQEHGIEIEVGYDENGALEHRISIEETEDGKILRAQRSDATTQWPWTLPRSILTRDRRRIWSSYSLRSRHLVGQNLMPTPTDCASG